MTDTARPPNGLLIVVARRTTKVYRVHRGRISSPVPPSMKWMTTRTIWDLLQELNIRGYEAKFEERPQ
jgi:hypothetical protein